VGSPTPKRVVETRLIRLLLESGAVVVCAGGGGVPVIRNEDGRLEGVEAVVDKDLATSVLAEALDADVLMVLTDVPHVMRGFGTERPEPILRASALALRREEFAAGSMGPKVDAVCRFVELTGGMAAIGRFEDAVKILAGEAGTIVTPDGRYDGLVDLAVPRTASLDLNPGLPG
jgi:carbamate kinase